MDTEVLVQTIKALREDLHRSLTGVAIVNGWETLQSADHLLDTIDLKSSVVGEVMTVATPYLTELSRLRSIVNVLKKRHPFLAEEYDPIKAVKMSASVESLGRDLWQIVDLGRGEEWK